MSCFRRLGLVLVVSCFLTFVFGSGLFLYAEEGNVPGRYIVVLMDWVWNPAREAERLSRQHGLQVGYIYHHALKGFVAYIPAHRLLQIQSDPDVKYVAFDKMAYLAQQEGGEGLRGVDSSTRNQGNSVIQPPQTLPSGINRANADLNVLAAIDGQDQRVNADVAIIDTGIDPKHPDLYVVGGINFSTGRPGNFKDGHGHGTHVSGTVAALDNAIGVVGMAPGARLWGVRVLDNAGNGFVSDVIAGIDWVTARSDVIEVANMSLGWTETNSEASPAHDAIRNSVAKGGVYVVAGGNNSRDAGTFAPATYSEVITVSAMADSDGVGGGFGPATSYGADDTFATFSNFGSDIDMAAPGVDVLSTLPGGAYGKMNGTSMASPHVTGTAALYIVLNGKPFDAAGVEAVRLGLIQKGVPQSAPDGFTGDPDAFPEPLISALF